MNFLEASRPSATIGSVGAPWPWCLTRSQVFMVDSASTIMIATSSTPSLLVTTRPATTMSNTERPLSVKLGKAIQLPSISETRVAPIGPLNGSPEICVDADAALMASTSYWWSGLSARTVITTWTSLRRPFLKVGRNGRSIRRHVRMASVEGRPSRRKHRVFIEVGHDCATSLLGQAPGLEPDRPSAIGAVVDGGFGELNFWTLHWVLLFSQDSRASSLCTCFSLGWALPTAAPRGRC